MTERDRGDAFRDAFVGKADFVAAFTKVQKEVHANAIDKGFWEQPREFGTLIALIHSEVSEALEGDRKPGPDKHCPEFTKVEVELADAIIRIMDTAEGKRLRVAEALLAKAAYNTGRPYMHGKRF